MKIDRSKIKKGTSEVPHECKSLIEKLRACSNKKNEFLGYLKQIKSWNYGKCELYHWADVLDMFDVILEEACHLDQTDESEFKWTLPCDMPGHEEEKQLVLQVLQFTSLLIEHSFTRHLYNSMEHLTALMASSDMTVVLGVLNLLYVFSKRSNFITRLVNDKKQALVIRLTHLAESWGGKENGFGLAECCQNLPQSEYPPSATTLHFEFYGEQKEEKAKKKNTTTVLSTIHLDSVDKIWKLAGQIMEELMVNFSVPDDKKILLFTHIRLAQSFSCYEKRMQCVHARLLAISILVYSRAMQENVNGLLYNGFVEELVDILELKDGNLVDIKAAALRTLTSVIHLERNPKLQSIIDATGASLYHGFLPVLVRTCISHMTDSGLNPFPQAFATSLFSFLYHLASYESGGDALVSCGMMESLLKVVNWFGEGQEHITFVTRAVRVVDLITNLEMQAFQTHTGLQCFINRLEHEVSICRKEQPFVIKPKCSSTDSQSHMGSNPASPALHSAESPGTIVRSSDISEVTVESMDTDTITAAVVNEGASTSEGADASIPELTEPLKLPNGKAPHCFPQRAALLKSMLNFLKKAMPDPSFSDSIRHLMDGSLPSSLKHIISNAEYYGPSLFLLATDVVTVYVYQEPSLLSSLQDQGLTDVVLHALLVKDVPATREVLSSLPNVFSALCLNARGLESFVQCKPFERLFKVLLSPDYLPAMRRRRSSDPPGDTASSLGSAMDELMRHQPSLKSEATKAIIKLLEKICMMGTDERYICQKPQSKTEMASRTNISIAAMGNDGDSSDEEEEEEEVGGGGGGAGGAADKDAQTDSEAREPQPFAQSSPEERKPIPLMDYVLNVMKFVEAILSNNTTDDHCREFIAQKGLEPLMKILGLPNLPIEFPTAPSCQAVSSVCKSVLTLAHEVSLLKEGLKHLNSVLDTLDGFYKFMEPPGGSILIKELVAAQCDVDPTLVYNATPLLHGLTQVHAYVAMFSHVCKVGQTDIRTMSVTQWGSSEGLQALAGLSKLYSSLVWESTILLSFCSEDTLPPDCDFGKKDLEKLVARELKNSAVAKDEKELTKTSEEMGSNGVSAAMESLSTHDSPGGLPMETDASKQSDSQDNKDETSSSTTTTTTNPAEEDGGEKKEKKLSPQMQAQLKQIKPLLNETSKLGKALAELFGLLVKLSVGSPVRQRRAQILATPTMPSPAAKEVARAITKLLGSGLTWKPPQWSPVPKLRLTFYICSVGFISPMLFDEKKFPYHLMLQKFVTCGGQDAMFDTFRWALTAGGQVPPSEGLEYDKLPDGTGEFLDAWLILMERMVNVKQILESPHTLPSNPPTFSPLQFLISTHKMAFETVMFLWGKTPLKPLNKYGRWMSESILAILCHIIKGECVIKEKLEKEKQDKAASSESSSSTPSGSGGGASTSGSAAGGATSTSGATATSSSAAAAAVTNLIHPPAAQPTPAAAVPQPPAVNQEHLQQLMDMGFTREHGMDALQNTNSLEQATEYILTHPPPVAGPTPTTTTTLASAVVPPPPLADGMELDGSSDEEQILRAIAMSLGESMAVLQGTHKRAEEKPEPEPQPDDTQRVESPLEKDVIDQFTDSMFPGCMQLMDAVPECVYKVCDLLSVITVRNGNKWREDILTVLVKQVADFSLKLMEAASPMTTSDTKSVLDWANQLSTMKEATMLAARLHLLTLLFEEMKLSCARVVEESGILDILTRLLDQGQRCFLAVKEASTPKWVAPLVLLLDLYEKMAVGSKRRADLEKIVGKKHVWKWFDDRSGRWCNYSNSNNKTIDDAYVAGESSIRFTAGRRRYTVQFGTMTQMNEETGNRRPIMLSLPSKEENASTTTQAQTANKNSTAMTNSAATPDVSAVNKEESKMETEDYDKAATSEKPAMKGLMPDNIASIIRSNVGLIGKPVDPETLHAVMRLTLRLTREHQFAAQFAELGGTKLILGLTHRSNFQGVTSLATLIFRHVMEEPTALRNTVEKVIRSATAGAGSSSAGVVAGSIGSKEINYVLRVLSPVACRDPALFTQVAKSCLRIALPPFAKRDEDDARLLSANTAQVLKCLPSKQTVSQSVDNHVKNMLQDLLNALTHTYKKEEDMDSNLTEAIQEVLQEATSGLNVRTLRVRQGTTGNFQRAERVGTSDSTGVVSTTGTATTENKTKDTGDKSKDDAKVLAAAEFLDQRPLLPKSALLRLLAELVRSYAGCAQLITHHVYCPGQDAGAITEECSSLAFVLDNLLPQCQESGDKDCPALAKVLIASLAASNHSPEAQSALVGEIKYALQRALMLPESVEKHSKLQAMTGLVSTVIDSCPVPGQMQNQVFKGQQSNMNNMVKLLLKKGLVTDLARIPHNLDLSSPTMASTMNAVLRPLETLSRIVNQPQAVASTKGSKAKTAQDDDLEATVVIPRNPEEVASQNTDGMQSANTDTQAERNTSVTQGIRETSNTANQDDGVHAQVETELESVLDDLLQRNTTNNTEDEVLGEIVVETMVQPRERRPGDNLRMLVGVDQDEDDDDDDNHDSQMVTQEISDVEDDTDDNTHADAIDEGGSDAEVDEHDDVEDEDDDDNDANTDEDEDDENEDDDEDEEEDEDGSDMEGDEDVYDEDNYFQLGGEDDLYVQLEDGLPDSGIVMSNTLGGASLRNFHHTLPVAMHDQENGNDPSGPLVPPAPSTVTASHPLLVRQADTHGITSSFTGRLRGMPRNRGFNRYNPNAVQTLQVQYVHDPARVNTGGLGIRQNTLLQNLFQRSNAHPSHFTFVTQNENRTIEDLFENMFPDPFYEIDGGNSGVLSNIPSALTRWTEEAIVLDGDTVHDCVTLLKPDIITELEGHRDKEIAERKDKRKKLTEEEEAKKEKERLEKESKTPEESKKKEICSESAETATGTTGREETGTAARDEESEEDKTIEWGTPPEGPLPTATTQANSPAEGSFLNPTPSVDVSSSDRSTSLMTSSQQESGIQDMTTGNRTTDTIPDAERAFLQTSDMTNPLQISGIGISSVGQAPSFVSSLGVSSGMGGSVDSTISSSLLNTSSEPLALRNFTNALGLGFSDLPISASMASTPALVASDSHLAPTTTSNNMVPMDTSSSSSSFASALSHMPPPSQPDLLPSMIQTPVSEIPLPGQPDSSGSQFSMVPLFRQAMGAAPGQSISEQVFRVPLSELAGETTQQQVAGSSIQIDSHSEAQATGTITPPQLSDITSSDNVTVNSSPISTEPNSVNDTGTPSSEQPPTAIETSAVAAVTSIGNVTPSSVAGTSAPQVSGASGGGGVPDGVDPSFLAALPESIRQEVIAEQLRLQRIQQRAQEQQQHAQQLGVAEVNPEFLAALPPNIQEEVLAQQRAEQARLSTDTAQPEGQEQAIDPASFISSLPASLRTQVLADMDDTMVAVLPPDLASEANMLRRELEDRHRRIMQERLFNQGSDPLAALLRHTGLSGRLASRYTVRPPTLGGDHHHWLFGRPRQNQTGATGFNTANTVKLRGRHLLDHEALACLLVMLFVDEPRLNSARLHRVLRNLCYHSPTRAWVIRALLSILHRTSECKSFLDSDDKLPKSSGDKGKKKLSAEGTAATSSQNSSVAGAAAKTPTTNLLETPSRSGSDLRIGSQQPSWLSISMDAALGCRANVFQVHRGHGTGKKSLAATGGTAVGIHPQASPVVCRHVLDALISLAKSFPDQFLPQTKAKETLMAASGTVEGEGGGNKDSVNDSKPSSQHTSPAKSLNKTDTKTIEPVSKTTPSQETDFWELLIKLDAQTSGKKGKNPVRLHVNQSGGDEHSDTTFENAPLGLLMAMLAHPVLKRSQLLTDRLLRLLGLVSVGIPDITKQQTTSSASSTTATVGTTSTATASVATVGTTNTVIATSVISSTLGPNSVQEPSQPSRQSTEATSQPQPVGADVAARPDETFNESMDISAMPDEHLQTSTPLPGKKEEKVAGEQKSEAEEATENPVLPSQLQLAVQVLTSKSCSEEGLEDATNLLLQLSRANSATRDMVLHLLLAGGRDLGLTVCTHIRRLLDELKDLNLPSQDIGEEDKDDIATPPQKDSPTERFGGVVINAPSKVKKSGRELQLPSMNLLTNKTASQQFLLRILKVIIQLREAAAKAASKKTKKIAERDLSSVSETMALLEAEAETIMELVQRERQRAGALGTLAAATTASSVPTVTSQSATTAAAVRPVQPPPQQLQASRPEAPMDVDQPGPSTSGTTPLEVETKSKDGARKPEEEEVVVSILPRLSEQLTLEELWEVLGECLTELAKTPDHHAVLVLQPAVEAFFLVHAGEKEDRKKDGTSQKREDQLSHLNADLTAPMSPAASYHAADSQMASTSIVGLNRQDSVMSSSVISINMPPDTQKFLRFAETHRTVLNQILRQSTSHLSEGPFSVLVDHTRILDFDVKRRYFRHELERLDEGRGMRREDLAVHVKREHVFEDSFRELLRKSKDDWKHRFYIVFEGEEGQDAGGLLREWYLIMSREIFNPDYVLFRVSPGDRVTYTINPSSHYNSNHLSYFKFVGRFLAKAIYDNKLLECYFTRSFYKHILGKAVRYTDMEAEDYSFYQGLVFLIEHNVEDLGYELTFSTEIQEFGVTQTRDLKPNGRNIPVTEESKREYVKLVCQERMTGAIRQQLNSFLEGFYEIIPKRLISIFNEQELELLMSGLPTIDIDDLKTNTEYHKYQGNSLQIQWFWRALRSFDQTDRAAFLQFVTGTSKVPLQGFAHLEGMNGTQKLQIHRDDRSTDRLPCAHTCFNQLDLPAYETYIKLREMLLLSIHECSEGFGLA